MVFSLESSNDTSTTSFGRIVRTDYLTSPIFCRVNLALSWPSHMALSFHCKCTSSCCNTTPRTPQDEASSVVAITLGQGSPLKLQAALAHLHLPLVPQSQWQDTTNSLPPPSLTAPQPCDAINRTRTRFIVASFVRLLAVFLLPRPCCSSALQVSYRAVFLFVIFTGSCAVIYLRLASLRLEHPLARHDRFCAACICPLLVHCPRPSRTRRSRSWPFTGCYCVLCLRAMATKKARQRISYGKLSAPRMGQLLFRDTALEFEVASAVRESATTRDCHAMPFFKTITDPFILAKFLKMPNHQLVAIVSASMA